MLGPLARSVGETCVRPPRFSAPRPLTLPLRRLTWPARRYPFPFSVVFTSCKTGLADYLTQTQIEKKKEVDLRRNAVFWIFGAWFLGGVQYGVYVHIFPRIFPSARRFGALTPAEKLKDTAGQRGVVGQVALDMLCFEPFVYFPAFYASKAIVGGESVATVPTVWREHIRTDLGAFYVAGVPAFVFNFTFCPLWARVPFVGVYSLFWTMYLSWTRGALPDPPPPIHMHGITLEGPA